MIEFTCGAVIGVPLSHIHNLRGLTEQELTGVTPSATGDGIEVKSAGVYIAIKALRDAVFANTRNREHAA